MAVPDTIDTSCSADGPPSRTTIGTPVADRRRSALVRPPPSRPVAEELDLERELDAVLLGDLGPHGLHQAAHVASRSPSGR